MILDGPDSIVSAIILHLDRLMYSASLVLLIIALYLLGCNFAAPPVSSPESRAMFPDGSAGRLPRIAYVWRGPPETTGAPSMFDEFLTGLREHGWVDGRNVTIELQAAGQDPARYPALIQETIAGRPDVIVVGDSAAAPMIAEATRAIPIVLTTGGDVVAAGMACAVNRPCGNVTGLSLSLAQLSPKRLEMLTAMAPNVRRVGFLRNERIPETTMELEALNMAAPGLGVEIIPMAFRTPADYDRAFQEGITRQIDALLVMPDGTSAQNWRPIMNFAAEAGLPDAYGVKSHVRRGGLFSYGAEREYNFRRAAFYVDRILRGTPPTELPIEQPARFDLAINLTRAQQLGLTFPSYIMNQATEAVR